MGKMIGWRFDEVPAADTRQALSRWWVHRRPSPAAPIPDGLVEDVQTARRALDDGLQRRLWDLATVLQRPRRTEFTETIAELDPWHVLWDMTPKHDRALAELEALWEDDQKLAAALRERSRRRERLERPHFKDVTRRRLRDLERGGGRLAAVLEDDDACRMLRFGAILCDMMAADSVADTEPDPDEVRALLVELTQADARRAAQAVLSDPWWEATIVVGPLSGRSQLTQS